MTSAPSRRAPAPSITIQVQSPLWEAEPAAEQTVRDAIAAAAATLSTADNEVSILLTDDKAIRLLNREWRGIDKPTNVLSFPAATTKASVRLPLFGDIVIAYETLKRECDDDGRIFLHHLAHLTVHGSSPHRLRSPGRGASRRDGRARKQDHDAHADARSPSRARS